MLKEKLKIQWSAIGHCVINISRIDSKRHIVIVRNNVLTLTERLQWTQHPWPCFSKLRNGVFQFWIFWSNLKFVLISGNEIYTFTRMWIVQGKPIMPGRFRIGQSILTLWSYRFCGLVCQIHNLPKSLPKFSWGIYVTFLGKLKIIAFMTDALCSQAPRSLGIDR